VNCDSAFYWHFVLGHQYSDDDLHIFCNIQIRSDKAREYLLAMPRKRPIPFSHKFHNADPLALRLLERLLAFDPKDRPTAEEVYSLGQNMLFLMSAPALSLYLCNLVQALADPYFSGLSKLELEPSAQPISKVDFEFEGRKLTKASVREMIYREVCNHFRSGWNICYSVNIGFLIFLVQTDFGVPSTDASGVHRRWRADSLPISKVQICTIGFWSTLYALLPSAQYLSISLVIRMRITILELLCMFSILVSKHFFPRNCNIY
jgi:serine/threonine protein kinase